MIHVRLERAQGGCIVSLHAVGHARAQGGVSLACGIVSSALRAFGSWVLSQDGLMPDGAAQEPGVFEMRIRVMRDSCRQQLAGASGFLIQELRTLCADFPDQLTLNIMDLEDR